MEKAWIKRDKQREVRVEYGNKYFANKDFVYQERVASLYENSIPDDTVTVTDFSEYRENASNE